MSELENTFDNQVEFAIEDIEYEKDAGDVFEDLSEFAEVFAGPNGGVSTSSISFDYARPAVSVDTKARFVTHDIIGGMTVRQKIGEEPIELSINGVCVEQTALKISTLKDAKRATILTPQVPGSSIQVQFASTSVTPFDDGGAGRITDGEILYNFDIKALEV